MQGVAVLARKLGIPVYFTEMTHRAWVRWMHPRKRMTYANDSVTAARAGRRDRLNARRGIQPRGVTLPGIALAAVADGAES